jgi:glucosylceramidase
MGFIRGGVVFFSAALLLGAGSLGAQSVSVFRTLPDLSEGLTAQSSLHFTQSSNHSTLQIGVDDSKKYQSIDGFGASLTDSSAWLLETKLSAAQRKTAMHELFDPRTGIGLSFLRQPLGASDLALNHYSFDEMPAGEKDPGLKHFSIEHDKAYILPSVREALAVNPAISVMVTPWSPPGWMKTKGTMIGGQVLESEYKELANYLVKSVQAYQAAGVPVRYLSIQNEPLYETKDYPGTLMPAEQQLAIIRDQLGPAMEQAKLKTKILIYDHNWDRPDYPTTILSDPAAAKYVAGTAFHCYGGEVSAQSTVHDRFPEKGFWETECSGGTWQTGNLLAVTAQLLIESTRNWAKSVVLWNMVLDQKNGPNAGGCATCRGLLTVDHSVSPAKVIRTLDYYAMGQASKFVSPGAQRIDSTDFGRQSLESVAFQNQDGSIALLVLNNAAQDSKFDVSWRGESFSYSLPAGAFVTFSWNPKGK